MTISDIDQPAVAMAIFTGVIGIYLTKNLLTTSLPKSPLATLEEESFADEEYIAGQNMPNFIPDDDIKYYLGNQVDETTWQEFPTQIDSRDVDTPDEWVPRHPDLIRLTGRHPFNCEAPLAKLHKKGFITPTSLHYVRSHGAVPQIGWHTHEISIGGMAPKPLKLTMADIVGLPQRSLPVTLVCCGNRRKEQNMIKQSKGFNWGAAGVSTGVWTGARLCDVLKLAGITDVSQFPNAHVRFASESEKGGDKLPGGVYGTSVPLSKAIDPSQDLLIAYMYNGKLLTPDHGYPVRLIVPGYVGGRMIKWITDIDLQMTESQDYYHFFDNRVFPPHVDADIAKDEGWWYKPEYICNDLSVNSAIAAPDHDEVIKVTEGETYQVQGYAYTGGGRRITRVEISLTSGATWRLATLNCVERPNAYGKYWSWLFWEIAIPHEDLAQAHEIVLRAWDEGFNTQPDKPTWNLMGMLNNPWFRIKIHVQADGSLKFEHPTLAGNQSGGWMLRMKEHPSLTAPGIYVDPSTKAKGTTGGDGTGTASPTSVLMVGSASDEEINGDDGKVAFDPSKPSFSAAEVAEHSTAESVWIIVKNKVYDCTPFLKAHPGGDSSILLCAGTDCTEEFDAIHSKKAWKLLDDYYIGQLRPESISSSSSSIDTTVHSDDSLKASTAIEAGAGSLIALNPKHRIPFTLMERVVLSPDSLLLRFALQSPKHRLGLPVGQHMFFSAKINGKLVMRAYTPTSSDHDLGHFDLVIKVYHPTAQFPEGGIMSQHLGSLTVGNTIDVKGPLGHVTYKGRGLMMLGEETHRVKNFALLCGGTGITPIYQIMEAVLRDREDDTKMFLIFANRTEADILLKDEIDALARDHRGRLYVHYILSRPNDKKKWLHQCDADMNNEPATRSVGHLNTALVKEKVPQSGPAAGNGNYALLCGPEGFLSNACDPALEAHGYTKDLRVYF